MMAGWQWRTDVLLRPGMRAAIVRGILTLLMVVCSAGVHARDVTDMAGRTVTLPERITSIYSSSHPVSLLLYALAPEMLVGINYRIREDLRPYLPKAVVELPVIGAVMGHGGKMDPEEVLRLGPDVVIVWLDRFSDNERILAQFDKVGLPVVFVRLDTLEDHPETLRFLGDLLGREERAGMLEIYISNVLGKLHDTVGRIAPEARRQVYYAEGPDGLATECDESWHAEAIILAGGSNVHRCKQTRHVGMDRVSLEQIMLYRPDFVLAQDEKFTQTVLSNPAWQGIPAIDAGAISFAPTLPFNWIDRPPSFMRAIGAQWLANRLYPAIYPLDIKEETRRFYRLFLDVELDDAQISRILAGQSQG
ncbi:MAG: ABC transporter substrate-binding protein [Corticimicrobacter sp.]|uniref:ABC transporter substrate-binding protein n=1 Tax=Corticimicrobacter sp. TaxID=2678536 RepID=UPI0032DBCEB8